MKPKTRRHKRRWADWDLLLLQRAERDPNAFETFYEKYCPLIVSYLTRHNSRSDPLEDLVQEVFARLWRNRKKFRGHSAVRRYVLGIARNVLSDHKKHSSRRSSVGWKRMRARIRSYADVSSRPDSDTYLTELKGGLAEAISELTSKQRQAINLYHFTNLSSQEAMANRASCSVDAFRSRLRAAHRHLHRSLCNKGFEDCEL